jgi:hypothetical protein
MAREAHRPSKRHRDASARKHDERRKRPQPSRGHKIESSASTSDDTRSGGQSHTLSAGALAQLNQENTSRKKKRPAEDPRRERHYGEREYRERDYRDRERRVKKATYREVRRDVYESPRGPGRPRERDRVVSGRRLEEGRRLKIRGGHGSYDSVEKEDYDRQPRRANKKRICESRLATTKVYQFHARQLMSSRDHCRRYRIACSHTHHCNSGGRGQEESRWR